MTEPARKRAHVLRSFTDAGTSENFEADSTPLIEVGAFANYEAAGLVRAPSDEAEESTDKSSRPARK